MKLRKLKLAGFKSFVDPTTVDFNSDLVGVVGPNGCGKSNIIDAVRWVMGETSAKNLRGGSMADVIFNGSQNRKPVGQASIELVFDNSEGKLGGEYSAYSEISIKREVSRDGQSDYYLNGTKCRRRDITDIFLGTGLGPRSYSIIEQGMISRVIEAKPENLRAFLEEAAGISVYKKRRHDTELRLKHTTENLDRIEDLIQEQERLLERLKRQSSNAVKFKDYDTERKELDLQLKAMRWRDFDKNLQEKSEAIREVSNKLEERLARRASIDNELTTLKVEHNAKTDVLNEVQTKYYEIGTEITKREQTLKHQYELQEQLQLDLLNAQDASEKIKQELLEDREKLTTFSEQLEQIEPQYQELLDASNGAEDTLSSAKDKLNSWNANWEQLQQEVFDAQKKAEIEKTKIDQIEKQIREFQVNIDRLQQEQLSLSDDEFKTEIEELTENLTIKEEEESNIKSQLETIDSEVREIKSAISDNNEIIDSAKDEIRVLKGKEASLQALQMAAMGKEDTELKDWLEDHNLANLPRLAESMKVDAGFEKAVETVLGEYLEAICVNDLSSTLANDLNSITELKSGKLMFLNQANGDVYGTNTNTSSELEPLSSKIQTSFAISNLMQGVYIADDISQAVANSQSLSSSESIVTKDGIWLGKDWFRVYKNTDAKAGILAREKQLEEISSKLEELSLAEEQSQAKREELKSQLQELEQQYSDLRQSQSQTSSELRAISSKLSSHQAKLDHINQRNTRIVSEIEELNIKLEENAEIVNASRLDLEGYIDAMASLSEKEEAVEDQKAEILEEHREADLNAREYKDKFHALSLERQTLITQVEGIRNGLNRLTSNLESTEERQKSLQEKLDASVPEDQIKEELEAFLEERLTIEASVSEARGVLDDLNNQVAALEKERHEIERFAEDTHAELDKVKMEWQSIEVRKDTIQEEFTKYEINVDEILSNLPENANEFEWAERIDELIKKIERLGPINLAAIEEYKSESERSGYLQSQHADLTEAHQTLEEAIKQIDKETKESFKETFEMVNSNFKELFPKLFGGGEAYLDLTGDDLLETGVTVMARPPGKKNSSIQLLSGGEKALTAVSLVFAIFQLNPAPFCMLDEVDAPLDDANVGRFCNMIKEMSEKVQFIVITHNKITMEIARQLAGVTMKEPGVSRLVAVDIDQAVKMVEV